MGSHLFFGAWRVLSGKEHAPSHPVKLGTVLPLEDLETYHDSLRSEFKYCDRSLVAGVTQLSRSPAAQRLSCLPSPSGPDTQPAVGEVQGQTARFQETVAAEDSGEAPLDAWRAPSAASESAAPGRPLPALTLRGVSFPVECPHCVAFPHPTHIPGTSGMGTAITLDVGLLGKTLTSMYLIRI